jgi:hypothetical protein
MCVEKVRARMKSNNNQSVSVDAEREREPKFGTAAARAKLLPILSRNKAPRPHTLAFFVHPLAHFASEFRTLLHAAGGEPFEQKPILRGR